MKQIAVVLALVIAFIAYPSAALEPWHDYYTAKAMKEKAAKKRSTEVSTQPDPQQPKKDTKQSSTDQIKDRK